MKKLMLASGLAALAAATPAVAADMPLKAPPPIAYGWSGVYLGANVGLSVGRSRSEQRETITAVGLVSSNETFVLSPLGIIGGAQIGVNWQSAPNWVIGLEADIQGSDQRDDNCIGGCEFLPGGGIRFSQRVNWFGTARARAGWTNGPVLFYLTGGYAYGRVTTGVLETVRLGLNETLAQSRSGWTAGAGIEAQLYGNWSGKVEYLYLDLGTVSGTVDLAGIVTFAVSSRVQDHIFRAGVNYKFGDPIYVAAAPRGVYKARPPVVAYNWSGIYVGGNAGVSVARDATSHPINIPSFGSDRFTLSPYGAIGGVGIGANWQVSPFVVWGLEADVQASGERDASTCLLACVSLPPGFVTTFERFNQRLNWFGTVRGRAGWSTGPALFYVTGGFAYGRIETAINRLFTIGVGSPTTADVSFAENRSGWTAGAGLEAQIAGNLTGKIEYLYLDLGSVSGAFAFTGGTIAGANGPASFTSRVRDHVFRVGVNYKLDWGPVVARY
jgi:outer membrane immunogenic protein